MTTQITVRLPEENVAWLDAEVAAGRFPSRTAGLAKLLTKAQRRQEDEADMRKILANPDPDEESRLEWMRTRQYPAVDDDLNYEPAAAPRVTPADVREWATDNGIPTSTHGRIPASTIDQPDRTTISK